MIDLDHNKFSSEQEKYLVNSHLIESPRERMNIIERWLKGLVGDRIEIYKMHEESSVNYTISGKFSKYERENPKNSQNINDPFDPLNLVLFINQGRIERAVRFADNSNEELIGRITNEKNETFYMHIDQLKRMKNQETINLISI